MRLLPVTRRARLAAATVGLAACLLLAGPAGAQLLPQTTAELPVAARVLAALDLEDARGTELIAAGRERRALFFPAGARAIARDRTELDALLAATVLLEEGARRGVASLEDARELLVCYLILAETGRAGHLALQLDAARGEATSPEDRAALDDYEATIARLEAHGNDAATRLGDALLAVRSEDGEISTLLAEAARRRGDYEGAARLLRMGIRGASVARRVLLLGEMEAVAGEAERARAELERAVALDPDLGAERERAQRRAELLAEMTELRARLGDRGGDASELLRLASLERRAGEAERALDHLTRAEDADPNAEQRAQLVEERAIALMEANRPQELARALEPTRDWTRPSVRLLELRLVAESFALVERAAVANTALTLDGYLASDAGTRLDADLTALEDADTDVAQFARAYLRVLLALVGAQRHGAFPAAEMATARDAVEALARDQAEREGPRRLRVLLALYSSDDAELFGALDEYRAFCGAGECAARARRLSAALILQTALQRSEPEALAALEPLLAAWPAGEEPALRALVEGTADLMRLRLGRPSDRERERLLPRAREALEAGLRVRWDAAPDPDEHAADFVALCNNLAYLALNEGDLAHARLYLEGARALGGSEAPVLIDLAVTVAQGGDPVGAFALLGLAGSSSVASAEMGFQIWRWVGHLYRLVGDDEAARAAFGRALSLYDAGADWALAVDDGVASGGPLQWALLFEEGTGLDVALEAPPAPLFFVPAPVSVLELSATGAP
jgi:tetratricopeptide (TPR) repeat protein